MPLMMATLPSPKPLDRRHIRIQPDIAVKIQQLVELKLHRWAEIVVMLVIDRNDRIQRIVAPRELYKHQDLLCPLLPLEPIAFAPLLTLLAR